VVYGRLSGESIRYRDRVKLRTWFVAITATVHGSSESSGIGREVNLLLLPLDYQTLKPLIPKI